MSDLSDSLDLLRKMHSITSYDHDPIDVRNFWQADYQYELICKHVKEFQDNLDEEHEVGIQLASFGQSILLNITDIGYSNPSIIDFYGYYNGYKAHLIQNINQLNFLLVAVPKTDPKSPARRIGFNTSNEN